MHAGCADERNAVPGAGTIAGMGMRRLRDSAARGHRCGCLDSGSSLTRAGVHFVLCDCCVGPSFSLAAEAGIIRDLNSFGKEHKFKREA